MQVGIKDIIGEQMIKVATVTRSGYSHTLLEAKCEQISKNDIADLSTQASMGKLNLSMITMGS